jgi:MFS family permease
LILVWRFIPESPVRAPARPDIIGAVLLSGGLIALLVALTEGEPEGWTSTFVVGLFVAAAALLAGWAVAETKVLQPMVDMRMLTRRPVLFTNLTALLSGFSLYATWVLLPSFYQFPTSLPPQLQQYATYGFGTSVLVAGLWILPCSAAIVVAGPVGGILGRRLGPRIPLAIGMLLFAIGAAGIALWHTTALAVSMWFMVCGIGIGFAFASMPRLIVGAVAPSETGVATGMNNVIRTIGGVIGAQIAAVLLAANVHPGTAIPTVDGFVISFWISAAGAAVGVVTALLVSGGGRRWRLVTTATPATEVGSAVATEAG